MKQTECINKLAAGYILANNGTSVYFYKGKQVISNPNRSKPYKFDSTSWRVVGRLPIWKRILNACYTGES